MSPPDGPAVTSRSRDDRRLDWRHIEMRFGHFTPFHDVVSLNAMSTPAIALPQHRVSRRARRRRHALNRIPLQWHDVPVARSPGLAEPPKKSGAPRLWLLAILAVAVIGGHVAGAWYADQARLADAVKPKKNTLALEIVRPPKPAEPPKVEPPPPKPRQNRAPPPIQAAAIAPADAPVAAPAEVAAAVEPAPPAPPPAPEPVKAAFGGIGYRNNPAPDYPAQAGRGAEVERQEAAGRCRDRNGPALGVRAVDARRDRGRRLRDRADRIQARFLIPFRRPPHT
jgi:hypothetical protein